MDFTSNWIDIKRPWSILMTKLLFILLFLFGCSPTEPENVHGCLDSQACNYNSNATIDNNSCWYTTEGCDCDDEEGSVIDECGVCDSDTSNDCLQDCNGDWGGLIEDIDLDGICDDVDECIGQYDMCGICNGSSVLDENGCCPNSVFLWDTCYDIDETTDLDRQGENLSGEIPSEIGNLVNLVEIHINNNNFTGSIPSEICNLSNLETLNLSTTNITGSIPECIGNLTNLVYIFIYNTDLNGAIPMSIGNLINLRGLGLWENQLGGNIPSSIGNLLNIWDINLEGNQLTGEIPSEINGLQSITSLLLDNNQLTGDIPSSIGDLTTLTTLNLHSNQLTGDIPSEIGNLTSLGWLYLMNNQLTGDIPQEVCDLIESNNLSMGFILDGNDNLINTCE